MSLLAIDPASTCGFALRKDNDDVIVFHNHLGKGDQMKFCQLNYILNHTHRKFEIERVGFEDCEKVHQRTGRQSAVAMGLRAVILLWAGVHGIPVHGIHPATLKKFMVKGNATKEQMRDAAGSAFPGIDMDIVTHDESDALCVLHWLESECIGEDANRLGS